MERREITLITVVKWAGAAYIVYMAIAWVMMSWGT
jgi:threonine/homoserine/homoserine lactone efflux protein